MKERRGPEGGGRSKIVENCVMSFLDDPFLQGNLLVNNDCDFSVDLVRQCSRIKIVWVQLNQDPPSYRDFHLGGHPCMTSRENQPVLMGGLNQLGWPIRTTFRYQDGNLK